MHAMMLLRSLASRNYLTEVYNWRWHYYMLTNEGIEFLRSELHLPAQVPQHQLEQIATNNAAAALVFVFLDFLRGLPRK